jgi:hypothetical protein
VRVPTGYEICTGKVIQCKHELDETVKGLANVNSMLDKIAYDIEFSGGRSDEYTVNVIAENMYAQCDDKVNQYNLMEIIVEHNTDGIIEYRDYMYIKHRSNKQVRKTTKGWHLCI